MKTGAFDWENDLEAQVYKQGPKCTKKKIDHQGQMFHCDMHQH